MCGIFGYTGTKRDANSILLHGLQRLEYRGYDSAGICVRDEAGGFQCWKAVGKVASLTAKVQKASSVTSHTGIAHTRWATHGGVTEANSHPHKSNDGKCYIVHNGIIENYVKLKKELIAKGFTFYSETDTEVITNLLQDMWTGDLAETVQLVTKKLTGAYALLIMHEERPDEIMGVRWGSPLLFGYNEDGEYFFSSDSQALSGYADKVLFLEEGDMLHVKKNDFSVIAGGKLATREVEDLDQEALVASKGDYTHFMLKEIFEQPNIMRRIFKGRVAFATNSLTSDAFHGMQHESYKKIIMVACGTSYNACMMGSYWMENLAHLETRVEIASEYENKPFLFNDQVLHMFLSQSGETADSIACLKLLKEQGGKSFGIVNVAGSTISRLTDSGLFMRAGTEIGVAATKSFTAQMTCMLLTALYLAKRRGLRYAVYRNILQQLEQVPMLVETVLDQSEYIRSVANQIKDYTNFFFLGRNYQLPIAYEASLKFKEITYIHSEAYPAGELKHGPLALIDENVPTVLFMPHDLMFEKNLSSLQEIKARSGKVLVVSDKKVDGADRQIMIPETTPEVYPLVTNVVGQLLAYHVADLLQRNIDKPRNLAKSVTVK